VTASLNSRSPSCSKISLSKSREQREELIGEAAVQAFERIVRGVCNKTPRRHPKLVAEALLSARLVSGLSENVVPSRSVLW